MLSLPKLLVEYLLSPSLCGGTPSPQPSSVTPPQTPYSPPVVTQYQTTPSVSPGPLEITFLAGPSTPGPPPTLELQAARRALKNLKSLLGPSALKSLVSDQITAGTAAWQSILAAAAHVDDPTSSDPGTRMLAEVHLTAVPSDSCTNTTTTDPDPKQVLTAAGFAGWFAASAFTHPEKLWDGHPEHYFIAISKNEKDGNLAAELVEPWGPILTHSLVPSLAPVTGRPGGGVKKPWMKARAEFPIQTVGEETLMDGSGAVVGDIHYSFRDLPASGDESGGTCGIEIILNMWMPSGTPEEVKEGISQHLAVEYYSWVGWAYEDIKSGAYIPA